MPELCFIGKSTSVSCKLIHNLQLLLTLCRNLLRNLTFPSREIKLHVGLMKPTATEWRVELRGVSGYVLS